MNKRQATWAAMLAAGALAVTGCATSRSESASRSDPCHLVVGGLIGAAAGTIFQRQRRARGAAIGAAAGVVACVAVNAASRQTRNAQQVEADYRRANHGQLPPDEPVVRAYHVTVNPTAGAPSGERLQVVSNMTVVRGARQPVHEVKEVLTLSGPDGQTRSAEKAASERPGSGAYENAFNLTLPKGVAPGVYPVNTQLYVNGRQMAERKQELRVLAHHHNEPRYMLADVSPGIR